MPIKSFANIQPQLGRQVYIDSTALVIGDVQLGDDTAIWPMTVVRGDVNQIRIGQRTNIQDGCVLHVNHDAVNNPGGDALHIGNAVTVGHRAVLHGCTIADQCLIGINAVILDQAILQSHVLLGANSLVPPKKELVSGYLYMGSPVRQIRRLTTAEMAYFDYSAQHYVDLKNRYLKDI